GYQCYGRTTFLGQDADFRVVLSTADLVVLIVVEFKVDVAKRAVINDMIRPLTQKFGPPKRQGPGVIEWLNERGQVVVFTHSLLTGRLDMRGGPSAPIPKLNEKDKKDL